MTTPWQGASATLAPEILVAVALACRDGERLGFDYAGRGREPAHRDVEPLRLVPLGRRWSAAGARSSRWTAGAAGCG